MTLRGGPQSTAVQSSGTADGNKEISDKAGRQADGKNAAEFSLLTIQQVCLHLNTKRMKQVKHFLRRQMGWVPVH